ncbi:MAG: MFS transporter [Candidatus Odinarchaeota archaeon]
MTQQGRGFDKLLHDRTILPLRVVLPITSIGVFMSAMDGSIVNVSLETMEIALGTDLGGIRWVVIIYLLTITSLIGLGGWLGDNFGRKKVFQFGMGIFISGSLLCSFSFSLELLLIARIIQAIGSAGLMANGLAIVITFVEPAWRGRAIGINSLVVASALSTGPVIGGVLTQSFGWPSIFLINVPIGLVGILLTQITIPETPKKPAGNLDYIGMATFALTALAFVLGVTLLFNENQDIGAIYLGILSIAVSIITGTIFIFQENRHSNPMISIRIMKDRKILAGAVSAFFCYMTINGAFFLLPFYYQEVLLFSQSTTGMLLIVSPLVMSISGPVTGLLAEKIDARKLATTGAVLEGIFIIILATINPGMSLLIIIVLVALSAGSLALFTNSNGTSVMNAAPKENISVVSGILNLSRNVAFALGTALSTSIFGLVFAMYNTSGVLDGPVFETAYYTGLGVTFAVFALFALIGALVSMLRGRERPVLTT